MIFLRAPCLIFLWLQLLHHSLGFVNSLKPTATALFTLLCGSVSAADSVVVILFAGYQFGGTFNTYNGELRIEDSATYGATIEWPVNGDTAAHFLFIRQDSSLSQTISGFEDTTKEVSDITIDYYHLGGTTSIANGVMDSFVSGSLGVTHFSPKSVDYGSENMFSLSLGLGADKQFNKRIGFRIQIRLILPIQFSSGSVYCGPDGCVAAVSGGTTSVQGDVTAGLIIRL